MGCRGGLGSGEGKIVAVVRALGERAAGGAYRVFALLDSEIVSDRTGRGGRDKKTAYRELDVVLVCMIEPVEY